MTSSGTQSTLHGLPLEDFTHLEAILSRYTHCTGRAAAAVLAEFILIRKDLSND